jgi:hypothetical protein
MTHIKPTVRDGKKRAEVETATNRKKEEKNEEMATRTLGRAQGRI